ncbi:hypothetical protein Salat_2421200 [Sesamum alatum]|uniref:Uncharacterized protein n=1 Tax=Sesamum alatum TaxID=300844 RepID=A0AAE1XXT9_9LAMI|nr:hypothetical protein Salat_2421200 [Sesamum alatum]
MENRALKGPVAIDTKNVSTVAKAVVEAKPIATPTIKYEIGLLLKDLLEWPNPKKESYSTRCVPFVRIANIPRTTERRATNLAIRLNECGDATCVARSFPQCIESMNPQWNVLNPKRTFGSKPRPKVPNSVGRLIG